MTVTQVSGGLGRWELTLAAETPDHVLDALGYFGHVAIVDGEVDVEATGDGLLTAARYVGVLRRKGRVEDGHRISGSGMVFWLGDEDGKGHVIESELTLTDATLAAAVTAVINACPSVALGTVHPQPDPAARYTGRHQFQSPREALSIICDAFGVEFRVNGDATVDVGPASTLYNTESPDTIIVRRGAGADLDLVALGGSYDVEGSVIDYSTRVVLLGQTIGTGATVEEVFATGAASAPTVPYLDMQGNPVKFTRLISESGETQGSVNARTQLQLNRFNRIGRQVKLTAEEYESRGNFAVGDSAYVYDPDTGLVDPANEVHFRGEVWHPGIVRISGITWPVVHGQTVAFRTDAGVWHDLTDYVRYETGGNDLTVGDLPASLTRPSDDPVQVRADAARAFQPDATVPGAPTGLALSTDASLNPQGETVATITASWTAPTTNADGSTITDLAHYRVEYRPTFRAPKWTGSSVTEDTSVDLAGLVPDLDYDVRVAAVDTSGNVSAWSAVATIRASPDPIAPPAPADPAVGSYLGQLRIEYAGTDNLGGAMPSDTNRVDVHVGTAAGFTPSAATRVSSLNPFAKGVAYVDAPYGALRYVRLIAVDHTGNVSAASGEVSGSTVQVADGDIASLNVGKLTAGTIDVEVLVAGPSGRVAAGGLTGQRTEMIATGIYGYDADETLTTRIDGANNLLTGEFHTGLPGTRRIEIGPAGSSGNEIEFYAPDGRRTRIAAFTGLDAGTEAIRMAAPISGTSDIWNALQLQDDEFSFLYTEKLSINFGGNFSSTNKEGYVRIREALDKGSSTALPGVSSLDRVYIDRFRTNFHYQTEASVEMNIDRTLARHSSEVQLDAGADLWAMAGGEVHIRAGTRVVEAVVKQGAVDNHGAHIVHLTKAFSGGRYGGGWMFVQDSPGVNSQLFCLWHDRSSFLPIVTGGHSVGSAQSTKADIVDLDGSALDRLTGLRPRKYRRVQPSTAQGEDGIVAVAAGQGRVELGLIAEEAPPEVVHQTEALGPAVDLYALATLTAAAVNELRARVEELAGPPSAP